MPLILLTSKIVFRPISLAIPPSLFATSEFNFTFPDDLLTINNYQVELVKMEFISREGGSNCYVVAGFMDIFICTYVYI
jgi:hypothetical protein